MKLLLLFLLAAAVALSVSAARVRWDQLETYSFEKYVSDFGKHYSSPRDYQARKLIFEHRLKNIIQHNRDESFSWKRGVNHLSDRTDQEFRRLLGYKKAIGFNSRTRDSRTTHAFDNVVLSSLPESVDWRFNGIISDVKDQGQCGSCWTFGTAESIESYWALATQQLNVLSEQQILDCTPNPNQCGGTGGLKVELLSWLLKQW